MTNLGIKGARARGLLGAVVVSVLAVAGAARISGDTFTIVRSTFAAGGGTSTGGDFTVASTIAQPEAGAPLIGGGVSVAGGFRAQLATVAVEDGPTLRIALSESGTVTISWLPAMPGYVLQESASLAPGLWVNSASGSSNPISLPASGPARFYRLARP